MERKGKKRREKRKKSGESRAKWLLFVNSSGKEERIGEREKKGEGREKRRRA